MVYLRKYFSSPFLVFGELLNIQLLIFQCQLFFKYYDKHSKVTYFP